MFVSMAVKLQSLTHHTRFLKWVYLSSTSSIQPISQTIEIVNPNYDFDQNINFLRNKLAPDNLIQVLNRTSDLNSALKIFKWASIQKSFHHTSSTYFEIILKLGLAGNVVEMEDFCHNMVKNRFPGAEVALVSLIHTFVEHCRIKEAMIVLANMNSGGYKPPVEVFNALLCAIVEQESRDFQNALFVYKEMVKAGVLPTVDTLNYLLEILFMIDRVDLALDQFRRMENKGCSPNSKTFEILVKGLIENGRVDEAVTVLEQMLELECQPDLSFYSSTIPLFCRENKLEEGVKLFRRMKDSDLMPDSSVYEALIPCLCKNLQMDFSVYLINEMIGSGIQLNENVSVHMINCYCELGKIDEAIVFLEDKQVNETAPFNALLEGCCNAGKILVANVLLEKMSERYVADCLSWNILIRWLCENKETERAYALLGRMIKFSIFPDYATYSALVVGNCRLRKYDEGMKLFRRICARCWSLDIASYSELVDGLCEVNHSQYAIEVFYYMSTKQCSLHSLSFNKLIKCVCDSGQVNIAVKLWQLAYYCGISCCNVTQTTLLHELSKLDNAKNLSAFLSQMLIVGGILDKEAYCILIRGMIKQNLVKECVLFFNMMVNDGLVPDPDELFDQLSFIANHSRLSMIPSTIEKISDSKKLSSDVYNLLITGLWKEGKEHEAQRLLDMMLKEGWLPDTATHKLLIGSNVREGRSQATLLFDDSDSDSVSDILAEGLGDS
ncbi:putative pentatricopeptide repeat-containing protein At3g16710, mitochondrial [Vicia villosa]|uniref:putative pentatricopeptide repeat-containing protein At3g16710, mitochondrial n=1 Tax=Vicia villosa TaxID=3911 RepID=UPI00273B3F72|nr:putative pentatricopeptide repeat-containing protein At3g16710, mitochondrial [Vicia villosa]XP_058770386.1 putative pentatricopeptide repeat-containing protein At3g16710, mitochondrial [Vicia villosa]XP_058770387.1 putative pentatricopeptide repeat-containing protein At3g16710, mitochondrial [Vicia villosa]